MSNSRHLSRPPLIEALLDFQLDGSSAEISHMDAVAGAFTGDGWTKSEIQEHTVQFAPAAEGAEVVSSETFLTVGYMVRDEQAKVFFQFRPDRVTVSHSQNYGTWEVLVRDALKALEAHVERSNPSAISRIGTRFINRLPLPHAGFSDFASMLIHPPTAPPGGVLTDFLIQEVVSGILNDYTGRVTIGTVSPLPGESVPALLLDIDVFKECSLPPIPKGIDKELSELRSIKNDLFFSSIREDILEKFQ